MDPKYRMIYKKDHKEDHKEDHTENYDHDHIQIRVHSMARQHNLLTENKDETIGDVKRCLLNNLKYLSTLREIRLTGKGHEEVHDDVIVSSLESDPKEGIVDLQLLTNDIITWTPAEQQIINELGSSHPFVISGWVIGSDHECSFPPPGGYTGDEVFIWILKNKIEELTNLTVVGRIPQPVMVEVIDLIRNPESSLKTLRNSTTELELTEALRHNTTITDLTYSNNDYREYIQFGKTMSRFFDMMAVNTVLTSVTIQSNTYFMKDLVQSLSTNNTLSSLTIDNSKVNMSIQDVLDLSRTLLTTELKILQLKYNTLFSTDIKEKKLRSVLSHHGITNITLVFFGYEGNDGSDDYGFNLRWQKTL